MNWKDEMQRIKDHFDNLDEDEFEEKLIEHGIDEIKSMKSLGISLSLDEEVKLSNTTKDYYVETIYDEMITENFVYTFSESSNIEVA